MPFAGKYDILGSNNGEEDEQNIYQCMVTAISILWLKAKVYEIYWNHIDGITNSEEFHRLVIFF